MSLGITSSAICSERIWGLSTNATTRAGPAGFAGGFDRWARRSCPVFGLSDVGPVGALGLGPGLFPAGGSAFVELEPEINRLRQKQSRRDDQPDLSGKALRQEAADVQSPILITNG